MTKPFTKMGRQLAQDMFDRSDDIGFTYDYACDRVREVEEAVTMLSLSEQERLFEGEEHDAIEHDDLEHVELGGEG